jgi:hypothetical protein
MPAMSDPGFQQQIMHFARGIAGANADSAEFAIAGRIAAAQIDLQRARHAALALMSTVGIHGFADNLAAVIRLAAIKRYEGRFFARRNKAIRELDAWQLAEIRRRAQNDKTNLTLAGKLAAVLARNEPGPSATPPAERTMAPKTERTRPVAGGDAQLSAPRICQTNLRATSPSCETGGNGKPCRARACTVVKRTRQCSSSSHKTNLATAEKRAAVRAELSSRCNRARAGMKKRTRAMPPRRWKVVRSTERSATRIHSCKTNLSWRAGIRPGRRRHIRAAIPGIARGYRSRAPGSNRLFRLLH